MKKKYLSFIFLLLCKTFYAQEVKQYQFNILRFNDSVRIESCLPMYLYNDRMTLPNQEHEKKRVFEGIPMHVIGSHWVDECLIIKWPNIPNKEIIGYILEFTKLREDQIIISE